MSLFLEQSPGGHLARHVLDLGGSVALAAAGVLGAIWAAYKAQEKHVKDRANYGAVVVFLSVTGVSFVVHGVLAAVNGGSLASQCADVVLAGLVMNACFAYLGARSTGRTAKAIAASGPATLLASLRMAGDVLAIATQAPAMDNGGVIAVNGISALLACTALTLALATRTRPGQEVAEVQTDDWFVPRGFFTKGMGKSSTLDIFITLVKSTWPQSGYHKLLAVIAFACLLAVRAINIAVPWAYKRFINRLSEASHDPNDPHTTDSPAERFRWIIFPVTVVYLVLYFAQGGMSSDFGVIKNVRSLCMIPLNQAAYRRLAHGMFVKLLHLDLNWHLNKQTGKVVEVVNRGLDSLQFLMNNALQFFGPACLDIGLACAYLATQMQPWVGIIVLFTMASYLPLTVIVTEANTRFRRAQNKLSNERSARMTDTLLNYENAKFFTAERYEEDAYMEVVDDYLYHSAHMDRAYVFLNMLQGTVVFLGVCAGLVMCAWGIARGQQDVGDIVLFFTLMMQVVQPLTWLGGMYRYTLRCLTDAENMIELLDTQPSIQNSPDAKALSVPHGAIEFESVSFEYERNPTMHRQEQKTRGMRHLGSAADLQKPGDRAASNGRDARGHGERESLLRPLLERGAGNGQGGDAPSTSEAPQRVLALDGVSFHIAGGRKVALVGATGSGKSTILRLLFRFYDPLSGAIRIDGTDIRHVTQESLRRAIGVVPQDMVLFNDTIKHNIRYGRLDASDAEVVEAAEAACIAEHIRTRFPHGFDTVVGERGLRLSGGEKQRVAFARALLKNPRILVLDEATSALDSITERSIQDRLRAMSRPATQVVVAHRLSTVLDADLVIVLSHGRVVESGTHASLAQREGGLYARMWAHQQEHGAEDIDALARRFENTAEGAGAGAGEGPREGQS